MVEKILELFDKNKNNILENSDLEQFGIEKKDLEKLGIKVALSQVEKSTIDNAINKTIPQAYQEYIKNLDLEEKKAYVFLFELGNKILGKKTIEILAGGDKPLPLGEVSTFLLKIIETEEDKHLLETSTIVLTTEEIQKLKEDIFTENYTKKKLDDFIKEQLNENISSSEIIPGTKLGENLKSAGYNPIEFMKNMDRISKVLFESKLGKQISKDTIHNMGTGLTVAIFKLIQDGKINTNQIFSMFKIDLKNKKALPNNNNEFIKKLTNTISDINKAIQELKLDKTTSENNDILMNSEKFANFIIDCIENNYDKEDIKAIIKQNQQTEHAKYDKKEIITDLKEVFDNAGEKITTSSLKENKTVVSGINTLGDTIKQLKEGFKGVKQQGHNFIEKNKGFLIQIKEILEQLGIWKYLKDVFDWILKHLGYKNGWEDIENKVETTSRSEYVIKYLKEKTDIENIKKEKNQDKQSIFYKGFEKNIDNISGTKVIGKISHKAMLYLSSLGIDETSINKGLDNLFESENFNKLLKKVSIKKDDFYKNAFKIEEQQKDNQTIKIGVIDFNEISKIIEEAKNKEIKKIIDEKAKLTKKEYTSKRGLTFNKLDKETKNKIIELVNIKNKKMKELVESIFPNVTDFSYSAYIAGIGYVESTNRYNLRNGIGAVGKYQFMPYTLKDYGVDDPEKFRKDPYLQEQIMASYTEKQFEQIAKKLKKHGIKPENGADIAFYLAKSHLGGAGAVLKNRSDGNITQNKYAQKATNVYSNLA